MHFRVRSRAASVLECLLSEDVVDCMSSRETPGGALCWVPSFGLDLASDLSDLDSARTSTKSSRVTRHRMSPIIRAVTHAWIHAYMYVHCQLAQALLGAELCYRVDRVVHVCAP